MTSDAHALFKAGEPGLLLVFMEPGPDVTLSEFHEWYDNEHVPVRIRKFATFRSATRYAVTSSALTPSEGVTAAAARSTWGAFYTISSNETFAQEAYTSLRSQRSQREAELFARLAIVDRRIYRLDYDSDADASITVERKRLGLAVQTQHDTPRYLVTNSVEMKSHAENDYVEWFEKEHVPLLSNVPGWRRSRRFTLIDNGVTGTAAKDGMKQAVPKILGLHEWDEAPEDKSEYKQACATVWRQKVLGEQGENLVRRERTTCELYRAWDPIAAIIEADKRRDDDKQ